MIQDPKGQLRVSLREHDVVELMHEFPKLTRTEITDAVARFGPMRRDVEAELKRLSGLKT